MGVDFWSRNCVKRARGQKEAARREIHAIPAPEKYTTKYITTIVRYLCCSQSSEKLSTIGHYLKKCHVTRFLTDSLIGG